MKSLKVFILAAVALCLTMGSSAQLRTRTMPGVSVGSTPSFYGVSPNTISTTVTADTLGVSDTIAYVVPVNANYTYVPFLSTGWKKIGSGTATITVLFFQGNTPGNCSSPVLAGSANATYTKTLTYSATSTTPSYIDFNADSAKVSAPYLKIYYRTSATASVQGSINTALVVKHK
jgi:hypothetical protein